MKITFRKRRSVSETFDFCFGVDDTDAWKFDEFRNHYMGLLTDKKNLSYSKEELAEIDKDAWREELIARALELYEAKDKLFENTETADGKNAMREIEKVILLQNVDRKWMEHLEAMDNLKEFVGLNAYAQRDPVAIYRLEGADIFDQMVDDIKESTVKQILAVIPRPEATKRVEVAKPTSENLGGAAVRKPATSKKVGRNDPCPCGSGKKYKKCCGMSDTN